MFSLNDYITNLIRRIFVTVKAKHALIGGNSSNAFKVSTASNGDEAVNKTQLTEAIEMELNKNMFRIDVFDKQENASLRDLTDVPTGVTSVIVSETERGGVFNAISSTSPINGGTLFAGVTVVWKREYRGAINAKWFGAKGDGQTDDYSAVQAMLLAGGNLELESEKVYLISKQLKIYSNTTIDLKASVLQRVFNTSSTGIGLMSFASEGIENITIKNGTLDVNGTNYGVNSANAFGGITGNNILIENVNFLDVVDYHAIDLANVKNVHIDKCRFLGQIHTGATTDKEAIQLDPAYSSTLGYGVIENFNVTNCIFGKNAKSGSPAYFAAIGNHSANIAGSVVKDILIKNNIFNDCGYAAVRLYAFENTTIASNTFNNCVQDIIANVGTGTNQIGCSDIKILKNTFNSSVTNTSGSIRLNGSTNKVDTVDISHNVFNIKADILRADLADNVLFSNNIMYSPDNVVNISNTRNFSIINNLIFDASNTNIFISGEASNIKISGNITENSLGRFIHATGTGAAERKIITVNDNTQIDGARTFCAFDSGSTSRVSITGNTITTGEKGIILLDPQIINLGVTGFSNFISDNNISIDILTASGKYIRNYDGVLKGTTWGSPEGKHQGAIGSIMTRLDGGTGTTLYVKESGMLGSNTGWISK